LLITWFFALPIGGVVSKSRVESQVGSSAKSQGKSSAKSQSKPRGKDQGARQGVRQGDVDETLVGKKVVIAVSVGDRVAKVVGTIVAMGRFWVVVSVEESEIPIVQGVAYLNKGSIIAYMPIPDNNPKH